MSATATFQKIQQDLLSTEPPPKRQKTESTAVQYVSPSLQLHAPFSTTPMGQQARALAGEQAALILRGQDPFLPHLMDVRVVSTFDENGNFQGNHVNIRSKPAFTNMIHHERSQNSMFCFMASDQLEPMLIAVVVHVDSGRVHDLTLEQLEHLEVAIRQLKSAHGFLNESYAYTPSEQRSRFQQHSRHFHLKIRIPTQMYMQCFPFVRVLGLTRNALQQMQRTFEPLEYKFAKQETKPWDEVREMILKDAYVSILNSI
jgi:hypothetical protein